MKAAILTIGDEILIGQVVDTNGAWIAENLNLSGIEVKEKRTISDKESIITAALKDYEAKVDLVIMTGGLGPTRDDITKTSLNKYFDGKLIENKAVLDHIHRLFEKRGYKVTEVNRQQALIPDTCTPLQNSAGTAPGMLFERSGTIFISLPGVPYEMKGIMKEEVLPLLADKLNADIIVHKTVMTQGIPESYLSALISDWESALPENIKLAYLPRPGIVRLRLSAKGKDKQELNKLIDSEITKLKELIPEDIFAFEDISLENTVGRILEKHGKTVSTAESCTGGNIARIITSVPGSSAWFRGSVVAYANTIKQDLLNVPAKIIETHGAVSQEVVELMASECRKIFETDYAIAVSGIAGPAGGSPEKPVGTTWICVTSEKNTFSKRFEFGEHRGRNIDKASITALNILRKMVLGYKLK